jgi:predicted nucleic acid-binding Zn ribbon protein
MAVQRCPQCVRYLSLSEFPQSSRGKVGSWCRACHRTAKCGAEVQRACDFCGVVLLVTERRAAEAHVYCSRPCKDRAKDAARQAAIEAAKPERQCVYCGVDMPRSMRADARFCSEDCNSAAHKLKRGNGRLGPGRRREIERAYVIERDGSRCHLCGKKCRPEEIHLDHVVPLSQGGSHDPENLRVSHAVCNLRKGDRPRDEQLLLIG